MVHLSADDEYSVLENLKDARDALERAGIEGVASVTFETDGTIEAVMSIDDETVLHIKIEDNDNKKTISYR